MALVLSDGQLTASSATLVSIATGSQYLNLTFFNTSASATATVTLTLARAGGTARNFARAELGPYEGLYVRGLGLDSADTLAGYASLTSIVDYLVQQGIADSDFLIFTRDATGAPKAAEADEAESEEEGPDQGQVEIIKRLDAMVDLLQEIR